MGGIKNCAAQPGCLSVHRKDVDSNDVQSVFHFFLHDAIAPTPKGVEPIVLLSCNTLNVVTGGTKGRTPNACGL